MVSVLTNMLLNYHLYNLCEGTINICLVHSRRIKMLKTDYTTYARDPHALPVILVKLILLEVWFIPFSEHYTFIT